MERSNIDRRQDQPPENAPKQDVLQLRYIHVPSTQGRLTDNYRWSASDYDPWQLRRLSLISVVRVRGRNAEKDLVEDRGGRGVGYWCALVVFENDTQQHCGTIFRGCSCIHGVDTAPPRAKCAWTRIDDGGAVEWRGFAAISTGLSSDDGIVDDAGTAWHAGGSPE